MKTVGYQQSAISAQKTKRPETIDFRLYLITDRKLVARHPSLVTAVEEALKGGVKAVQLREKELGARELLDMAYKMRYLTKRYNARLFINDRVDVAMAVGADGVHLGQESMPPSAAKKASKNGLIVGVSAHSPDEAKAAMNEGADFITFGPVYPTPSKMRYGEPIGITALKDICPAINIPVFAIGGITPERLREVKDCGCYGAAVISAILSSDDIKKTAEKLMRQMQ